MSYTEELTQREVSVIIGTISGEERSCKCKKNYRSKRQAKVAAIKQTRKFGNLKSPYICTYCGNWHVGRKISVEEKEQRISNYLLMRK